MVLVVTVKRWHRVATVSLLAAGLALLMAGCGDKGTTTGAADGVNPAPPPKPKTEAAQRSEIDQTKGMPPAQKEALLRQMDEQKKK